MEKKNDFTIDIDIDEGKEDEFIEIDLSKPETSVIENQSSDADDLTQMTGDLMKTASGIAGSLGKLAIKKGEEFRERIEDEINDTSARNFNRKITSGQRQESIPIQDMEVGSAYSGYNNRNTGGNKKNTMTILIAAVVVLIALLLIARLGGDKSDTVEETVAKESYSLQFHIAYDENIIFSTYDAEVYIDDEKQGAFAQGEVFNKELTIEEGTHTIKFCKSGDSSVNGSTTINLDQDKVFSCTIAAHSDSIDISDQKEETPEEYTARLGEEEAARMEAEEQAEKEKAEAEEKAKKEKEEKAAKEAEEKQKEIDSREYTSYNVVNLEDDLDSNAAAAKDKYYNQYIEVTGKVDDIDSDSKYFTIIDPNNDWDFVGVQCFTSTSELKDQVKTLKKGEIVTVGGKITLVGELLGYSLETDYIK